MPRACALDSQTGDSLSNLCAVLPHVARASDPVSKEQMINLSDQKGSRGHDRFRGGTSRIDSFSCTIADESLIALALRVVQGLADIWDSRVTVLYHRTESSPQRNVPGDAIVGSCTYFGLELLIDETQLPPQGGGFSVQEQNDRHPA